MYFYIINLNPSIRTVATLACALEPRAFITSLQRYPFLMKLLLSEIGNVKEELAFQCQTVIQSKVCKQKTTDKINYLICMYVFYT